ncbi:Membrane-associated guanylate kinase, WW and PDZ domain-containing protein 2 [Bagarius yarrelli]|uniref:Membrane-associated guanylate kinase, WW and PDZ domain-containing protein 2 n=1 Tax=Bagarius yarrelli TaxID=175774 RepID=A0A556V9B4_BAGYA|nr:Membrane-associated guanylate kinase, WW and PDZ domain-containing protein 2 [Bagarius yarrelli]
MSKPAQKKTHWSAKVSECAVRRHALGDVNVPLHGGAENGEFVYVGRVDSGTVSYDYGTLSEGELLLEVENLPVSGLPLYDVLNAVRSSRGAVRLKTVRQGKQRTRHSSVCSVVWCVFTPHVQ